MKKLNNKGYILIQVIVFGAVAIYLMLGLVGWVNINLKSARHTYNNEIAMQIAEAGAEYYRWHLAHDPYDYEDGTGGPGPYVHDFLDKDGKKIGQYELEIEEPELGSTVVTITSKGTLVGEPNISRTIKTVLAKPSFAQYILLSNGSIRVNEGSEFFGKIHSNRGVVFNGLAHNLVTSAYTQYYDWGTHSTEWGVRTEVVPADPSPPTPLAPRTDIFEAGREVGVPVVDFDGVTGDLGQIKIDAQADGFYRTSSGALGYHIVFKTDDTFDLYTVDSYFTPDPSCEWFSRSWIEGWGSWSIENETLVGNFPNPNNGLIFLEDHVFVDGQIDSARITIAAAAFPDSPATRKNIIINNDLLYTNKDGQDVIGLIAQKDIIIGLVSEDDLEIDAALIAQNGRYIRFHYRGPHGGFEKCGSHHEKNSLSIYGSVVYNLSGQVFYDDEDDDLDTGYRNREYIYDANLFYNPPPSYPVTSDQYETLTWDEIE